MHGFLSKRQTGKKVDMLILDSCDDQATAHSNWKISQNQ